MASVIEVQACISRVAVEPRNVDQARAMRDRLNTTNQAYFMATMGLAGIEQGMEP